ncbi:hypothetical protein L208DRAFT_1329924 [Tricholoma matsutake]|nr:hypothetical protein L208DRAFT_1329924 [Tricholoma matsutake 945]
MLTLGSLNAPHFKGKCVDNFLDSLKVHADSAEISHNDLPVHILQYCHQQVCYVIELAAHWTQHN